MAVTPDDARHVAHLARLGLPEQELAMYVGQLNGILAHMDALQRVESAGAADAAAADAPPMATRADALGPVPLAVAPAQFAPSMRDGFFLVPRLSTHEDAGDES